MYVKENDLSHGEWEEWLKSSANMSPGQARKFITVAAEFKGNRWTSNVRKLGLDALYQIATMPEEQREKPQTIPSTGKTKTVDEMTVRMVTRTTKLHHVGKIGYVPEIDIQIAII